MKKCFVIMCFVCLCIVGGCGRKEEVDTSVGNVVINDLYTMDFDGNMVSQQKFSDKKITMINIWGTFCNPCIEEMPVLSKIEEKYSKQGFQVIGIPVDVIDANGELKDKQYKEAQLIISDTGVHYCNLVPTASLYRDLLKDVESVPQTIFVNSEGRKVGTIYYGAKTEDEWSDIIEQLLNSI